MVFLFEMYLWKIKRMMVDMMVIIIKEVNMLEVIMKIID
jgi:hypothetical protein